MQIKNKRTPPAVSDRELPFCPVDSPLEDEQLMSMVGGQRRRDDHDHGVLFEPEGDLKPKPKPA